MVFMLNIKENISKKIYKKFCNLFNILPITDLVGEKILCMHGGLAYELKDINELKKSRDQQKSRMLDSYVIWYGVYPDDSLFFDFCTNKDRGISVCFSKSAVDDFTKNNDLDLICRAHQVVEEGFQFFGEFDNNGGILKVNENMVCSLYIIKQKINNSEKKKKKKNR